MGSPHERLALVSCSAGFAERTPGHTRGIGAHRREDFPGLEFALRHVQRVRQVRQVQYRSEPVAGHLRKPVVVASRRRGDPLGLLPRAVGQQGGAVVVLDERHQRQQPKAEEAGARWLRNEATSHLALADPP